MKLLIIEDNRNILSFLKQGFIENGDVVDSAFDGENGLYLAIENSYDIIVIDWMLPKLSGIEIIQKVREQNIDTPIIMLTAKGDLDNKIKGLKIGADDYIVKPFSFKELLVRIEVLYRRVCLNNKNSIEFDDVRIDFDKREIFKNNQKIEISNKEYQLLMFLIQNKNSYVSKHMIENQLWNSEEILISNVIEVTIHNLRKKISKTLIKSFRGLGYKIEI
jgi:DNA-binding response OmpR family regulator